MPPLTPVLDSTNEYLSDIKQFVSFLSLKSSKSGGTKNDVVQSHTPPIPNARERGAYPSSLSLPPPWLQTVGGGGDDDDER